MAHDAFRDTAQECARKAMATVAAEDNEVGWPIPGHVNDDARGLTDAQDMRRAFRNLYRTSCRVDHPAVFRPGGFHQFPAGKPDFGSLGRRPLENEDRLDVGLQRVREIQSVPDCLV